MDALMQLRIERPMDPDDRYGSILVTVTCQHGVTVLPWRRACPNGCQERPGSRALRCKRVSPTDEALRSVATLCHGQRMGCGCDESYWMTEGPEHPTRAFHVQAEDRRLTSDEYRELGELGPARYPWEPVC